MNQETRERYQELDIALDGHQMNRGSMSNANTKLMSRESSVEFIMLENQLMKALDVSFSSSNIGFFKSWKFEAIDIFS